MASTYTATGSDPIDHDLSHNPEPSSSDSDTCRICRGEAQPNEPLFYPCKCSGSIKFVHQECLMEWLSHSQKKYCELCKTPFRFTKLYHPQMPPTIPTTVFLRKAIVHILKHLLTWGRAVLVSTVWLICLPWTMRGIWRMFFWLGDAGWARTYELESGWNLMRTTGMDNQTAWALIMQRRKHDPTTASNITGASGTNYTTGEPLLYRLFKMLTIDFTDSSGTPEIDVAMGRNVSFGPYVDPLIIQKHSSVLSEVTFFRNLTDSSAFNRVAMDIGEGLIITLSVVVVFILIFLIREWVIQQQPVIDIGVEANNVNAHDVGVPQPEEQDAPILDEENQEMIELEPPATDAESENGSDREAAELINLISSAGARPPTASDEERDRPSGSHPDQEQLPERLAEQVENHILDVEDLNRRVREHVDQLDAQLFELHNLREEITGLRLNSAAPDMPPSSGNDNPETDQQSDALPERPPIEPRHASSRTNEIQRQLHDNSIGMSQNADGQVNLLASASPLGVNVEEHSDPMDQSDKIYTPDSSEQSWNETNRIAQEPFPILGGNGEHSVATRQVAVPIEQTENPVLSTAVEVSESDSTKITPAARQADFLDTEPNQTDLNDNDTYSFDHVGAQFDDNDPTEDISASSPSPDTAAAPSQNADQIIQTVNLLERKSWTDYLYNLFWGDIVPPLDSATTNEQGNDERVLAEVDNEEPFIPFEQGEPVFQAPEQFPRLPAANILPVDGDGEEADVDDIEDLEGVLELIGMQGNIVGLFQNALFSGLLIMGAFLWFVFLPYEIGKTVLLFMANIDLLWQMPLVVLTVAFDLVADIFLFIGGHLIAAIGKILYRLLSFTNQGTPFFSKYLVNSPEGFADRAGTRLVDIAGAALSLSDPSLLLDASIQSHATLDTIRDYLKLSSQNFTQSILRLANTSRPESWKEFLSSSLPKAIVQTVVSWWTMAITSGMDCWKLVREQSLSFSFSHAKSESIPLMMDPNARLAYWNANDRLIAMLLGYATVCLLAAVYVFKLYPVTSSPQYQRIETKLKDIIVQAGGVLKVIFIISIEMIVFPLFCGFLLDFALLPLFEYSSVSSRCAFTMTAPWTSGFVHWFVGTCYMFHFALFVSMCRKIMRTGVLYFIRDPDDPNFHPVRDVLERSVGIQLRKIAFSAVVYGTLIVVCLGGVVWGLWLSFNSVLPIHWTSSHSALEFPLDILFYNFLTPLVVRVAKPADGLHAMYQWWFKQCAQKLRLSNFLFGQSASEEEGHHVRRTWSAWLAGKKAPIPSKPPSEKDLAQEKEDVYFKRDGKFVRAPKLDHIRIPKGTPVFVEVDENNQRVDGLQEEGIHANDNLITRVYIPPWFRVRIGLFVFAVWMFAAATGVCITILPLLFGRQLLYSFAQDSEQVNDIYAFSLGIYILGAIVYSVFHLPTLFTKLRNRFQTIAPRPHSTIRSATRITKRVLSVIYVYSSFAILLPILLAFLLELYILLPLHSFFSTTNTHVVHLVQDWTLGILYIRIFTQILFAREDSVPARILRAVLRPRANAASPVTAGGYLDPNAALATRAFIVPALLLFMVLAITPLVGAGVFLATTGELIENADRARVIRLAYPLALFASVCVWLAAIIARATTRWRARIRDEIYLIGERLHNFGEKGRDKGKAVVPAT